jgi:hypothetical protein
VLKKDDCLQRALWLCLHCIPGRWLGEKRVVHPQCIVVTYTPEGRSIFGRLSPEGHPIFGRD